MRCRRCSTLLFLSVTVGASAYTTPRTVARGRDGAFGRLSSSSESSSSLESATTVSPRRSYGGGGGDDEEDVVVQRKREILRLLGATTAADDAKANTNAAAVLFDPVLACPSTKEPLVVSADGPLVGDVGAVRVSLRTADGTRVYGGRTDAYYDLLNERRDDGDDDDGDGDLSRRLAASLAVLVPPPLRALASNLGNNNNNNNNEDDDDAYVPMRDLFTSPAVSFAYERGWRQGFAQAGFPGPDREYEMVRDYFAPCAENRENSVVVDMSCATGLFTRRLARSGLYDRVLGCDYSASMLDESRRRLVADRGSMSAENTRLELVRCDVARLPFASGSVDALHAGAAMHCWPEVDQGLREIHRALRPGGRYFASTFLSTYFSGLRTADRGSGVSAVRDQTFQYFESLDVLRNMVVDAGFDEDKVTVEKLGAACAIIRCEK